jgi:hypothetical protein
MILYYRKPGANKQMETRYNGLDTKYKKSQITNTKLKKHRQ